jgi:hypothetical protein
MDGANQYIYEPGKADNMGSITRDDTVAEILYQTNSRFAPGEPLREMVAIQNEFRIFSERYSLKQAYRLLHIVPADFRERERYYKYLELLKRYPSDQEGVSGHDRIVRARQQNLESDAPLPMFIQTHLAATDDRVTVAVGRPVPHETQEYVVISIPTVPAGDRASRIAARVRQIAESVDA